MKLVKNHRTLNFKQSNWLKSYFDFILKKENVNLMKISLN